MSRWSLTTGARYKSELWSLLGPFKDKGWRVIRLWRPRAKDGTRYYAVEIWRDGK